MALTIWCNSDLDPAAREALEEGVRPHELVFPASATSNLAAGGADEVLTQADIAFGQPDPQQAMELPRLRWIQLTSAGYTRYDFPEFGEALRARGAAMTNSSSVFDEPCAQHMLAFMLAVARRLPDALASQWNGHVWDYARLRGPSRVLEDETVLILGFGAIGRRLAELLSPFRLRLIAVRRTVTGDEPIEVHPISELDALLPLADHVANVLPASRSTDGLMSADRFALLKPGARFYNVGRGTTVDQAALVDALTTGHLSAAYLDVTDPEPLPPDAPLWSAPHCYITPHVAGGRQDEMLALVHHVLANLKRFDAGEGLVDRVV